MSKRDDECCRWTFLAEHVRTWVLTKAIDLDSVAQVAWLKPWFTEPVDRPERVARPNLANPETVHEAILRVLGSNTKMKMYEISASTGYTIKLTRCAITRLQASGDVIRTGNARQTRYSLAKAGGA